jgi:hypothetical protein
MAKQRAFFIVGHEDWGKSWTLRALTGGLHRSVTINGRKVQIKRMSNDDKFTQRRVWLSKRRAAKHPRFLAAFCPKLVPPDDSAKMLIDIVRRQYTLYFWVLERSQKSGSLMPRAEIGAMRTLGTVRLFPGRATPATRATDLRKFLGMHV